MVVNHDDVCALTHRPTLPPAVITETTHYMVGGEKTLPITEVIALHVHCLVVVNPQTVLVLSRGRKPGQTGRSQLFAALPTPASGTIALI